MNNIYELRKRYGLTQAQLAEIMQCTQGAVAKYESGEQSPSVDRAWLLITWVKQTHGGLLTLNDIYKAPEKATA